jgi:hypothetical protein
VQFRPVTSLDGDWQWKIAGKSHTGPLQSWSELGMAGYWGEATYRKQFTMPARSEADPVWLDLGMVQYAARVRLNGKVLGQRAWGPFRWDVSSALRTGVNVLEVDVANTRANELAGNPANLKNVESKGWLKNSYINMYLKFDQEMVPSGLIGPVTLNRIESAR